MRICCALALARNCSTMVQLCASIDKVNAGDDAAMLPVVVVVVGVVGVVSSTAAVDDNFATAYFSTGNSTQRTASSQFVPPPLAPCLLVPSSIHVFEYALCVLCYATHKYDAHVTRLHTSETAREMRRWRQWKSRELDGMGDVNKFIQKPRRTDKHIVHTHRAHSYTFPIIFWDTRLPRFPALLQPFAVVEQSTCRRHRRVCICCCRRRR